MTRTLVLGATGYVGSRLVPRLVAEGHDVRCLVRAPDRMRLPDGCEPVEIVAGDVLDPASVRRAVQGIEVIYYLVHSLADNNFAEIDATAARLVTSAAHEAGARRIVYLGGLRPSEQDGSVSRHLASRAEVGDLFLDGPVPAVVLQASMIIGSGSTSYELLRYLTERAPVLPLPALVDNRTQPIAVRDVLHYLVGCVTLPDQVNRAFDIGGPDVLSYREMIQRYGRKMGLTPRMTVLTPVWSASVLARLAATITPVSAAVAEPLIESMDHELVCRDTDITEFIAPAPGGPLTFERAVCAAAVRSPSDQAADAPTTTSPGESALPHPGDPPGSGGPVFTDERVFTSSASARRVWETILGIEESGWFAPPLVERAHGLVSRLLGAEPARWRVTEVDADRRRMLLRGALTEPGQSFLELSVGTGADGVTSYRQRLVFVPSGARGHVYWLALRPVHEFLHDAMARNVVLVSQRESTWSAPVASLLGSLTRGLDRLGNRG